MPQCQKCFSCQVCVTSQQGQEGQPPFPVSSLRQRCQRCIECQSWYGEPPTSPPAAPASLKSQLCRQCYECQVGFGGNSSWDGQCQGTPRQRPADLDYKPITNLTVFPTEKCNLRCHYCFLYNFNELHGEDMTLETGQQMIHWFLSQSHPDQLLSIHWFGGEPLMNFKLIEELVPWANHQAKIARKEIRWGLTTNLTLITEKVNAFLRDYDFYVLASMDGWKDSHDTNRLFLPIKSGARKGERIGSWEKAFKGLERTMAWHIRDETGGLFSKRGGPYTIRWTLTPLTTQYVKEDIPRFVDLGFRSLAICPIHEGGWDSESSRQGYLEQLRAQGDAYIEYMRKGIHVRMKSIEDGFRAIYEWKRQEGRCGLANANIGIGVDGTLFRCHRFVDRASKAPFEVSLGSVYDGVDDAKRKSINERWNIRKLKSAAYDCNACIGRVACMGGCLTANYDVTGDDMVASEFFCWQLNRDIEEALRVFLILKGEGNQFFKKVWDNTLLPEHYRPQPRQPQQGRQCQRHQGQQQRRRPRQQQRQPQRRMPRS